MLSVDLTIPIVLLCVAAGIVLAARAYAAWAERAIDARTDALLARFDLGADRHAHPREPEPVTADEPPGPEPRA